MGAKIPPPFGIADLTIAAGATFEMPVTWSSKETGQAIDLTGYTARMQIRADHASASAEIELTTENGRIVIDGPAGKIALTLTALNGTDVAFLDSAIEELRTYRFNGSTWSLAGSGLSIGISNFFAITAINGTDIAFFEDTIEELRTYRFGQRIITRGGPPAPPF